MKLQTRIILWALFGILLATTVTLALNLAMLAWKSRRSLERNLFEVADTVAGLPEVRSGLTGSPFEGVVQDRVHKIGQSFTGVDTIVVCDMDRQYFSTPNVFLLGLRYEDPAADDAVHLGARYVRTTGTMYGEMIRAYAPVREGGKQVGFVEVGAMADKLEKEKGQLLLASLVFLLAGLAIGAVSAIFQARKIKHILHGLEPQEIAKLYQEHAGMIEAMREGVIAVNGEGEINMLNESARKLLGLGGPLSRPAHIRDLMPDTRVPDVLRSGEPEFDYEQRVKDRVILSNMVPVLEEGKVVGVVETLQDKTEAVLMAEELTGTRQLVDALRANSHEFSNKLQAVLGMLEMEDHESAKEFILGTQARHGDLERRLVQSFRSPMLAGLLLGKCSAVAERGARLSISPQSSLGELQDPAVQHELATIIGNLVDNAVESTRKNGDHDREVALEVRDDDGAITVRVKDNGEGIRPGTMDSIFIRGFSTKGAGRGAGLYLVKRSVRLLGGTIAVDSRPGATVFTVTIPHPEGEKR